jgi:hypothetical protein
MLTSMSKVQPELTYTDRTEIAYALNMAIKDRLAMLSRADSRITPDSSAEKILAIHNAKRHIRDDIERLTTLREKVLGRG